MLEENRYRLILWTAPLFGLGIGLYFLLPSEPSITPTLYFSAICATLLIIFKNKPSARLLFSALLIASLGVLRAETNAINAQAPILYNTIFFQEITGKIVNIEQNKLTLSEITVDKLTHAETPQKITISLKEGADKPLNIGDTISGKATLFPPPAPAMPGAYDFARMFYFKQIGAVGYAPKEMSVIAPPLPPGEGGGEGIKNFEQKLNTLRLNITGRIIAVMGERNGNITAAMTVGEQSGVDPETSDIMRNSGIYHILSISGLHMSLAAMLFFVSLRFLLNLFPPLALRIPVKKISALLALFGSFGYLLLAGYPVPAARSFIMVACVMLAILFGRSGINIYTLAWAAILTLLWQPESLLSASFQLSFAATLAIVALYEKFGHFLTGSKHGFLLKIIFYFLGAIATSLAASLATAPFIIYHFERITFWGIAANAALAPLISLWIMPFAVIALLAMPFGAEYYPLHALDYGISLMMDIAAYFANLPFASVISPPLSFSGLILCVFGGLWLSLWQGKIRLLGIPLAVFGMMSITFIKPYDLLISPDAKTIAIRREDGNLLFLRGESTDFAGQVWLRYHGLEKGIDDEQEIEKLKKCDDYKCTITARDKKIVITGGKKGIETACDKKPDIVIAKHYLGRIENCKNVPLVIDKAFLDGEGATALRFSGDGQIETETARQYRGKRPWTY